MYVAEGTQRRLDFVVRKIGEQGANVSEYVEQGFINLIIDIGKVCLCDTNRSLHHKEPLHHSGKQITSKSWKAREYSKR